LEKTTLSPVGVIYIDDEGTAIAASFLYIMPGTSLGQIAWTTTNPDAGLKIKHTGVNMCLNSLFEIAQMNKIKDVLCFSSSSGLSNLLKKRGLKSGKQHDVLVGYFKGDE
jgi:hypothetical protein